MRNPAAELARRSHVHAFVQDHAGFTANVTAEAVGSAAAAAAAAAARRRRGIVKQSDPPPSPPAPDMPGLALDLLLASGEKERTSDRTLTRLNECNACKDTRAHSANTGAGFAATPQPQLLVGADDARHRKRSPSPTSSSALAPPHLHQPAQRCQRMCTLCP